MSIINFPYAFHLYNLFEPYIDTNIEILVSMWRIKIFYLICIPQLDLRLYLYLNSYIIIKFFIKRII